SAHVLCRFATCLGRAPGSARPVPPPRVKTRPKARSTAGSGRKRRKLLHHLFTTVKTDLGEHGLSQGHLSLSGHLRVGGEPKLYHESLCCFEGCCRQATPLELPELSAQAGPCLRKSRRTLLQILTSHSLISS